MLTLKAYAKINLTLEVVGRRDDGYHDILSVFQTVNLFDSITLEASDTLSLECDDPELGKSFFEFCHGAVDDLGRKLRTDFFEIDLGLAVGMG